MYSAVLCSAMVVVLHGGTVRGIFGLLLQLREARLNIVTLIESLLQLGDGRFDGRNGSEQHLRGLTELGDLLQKKHKELLLGELVPFGHLS